MFRHRRSFGSSAEDNFNKMVQQKKDMASKMKRGPYTHHAKEPLKIHNAPDQDWIKKHLNAWDK